MAKKKDAFRKRVAVMLKVARQLTGLTLEDVGQKVGMSSQTIGTWENCVYSPSADKLFELCVLYRNYGITPERLADEIAKHEKMAIEEAPKPTRTRHPIPSSEIRERVKGLRSMREAAGLTQVKLGSKLGIKRCTPEAVGTVVSEVERGIRYHEDALKLALEWMDEHEQRQTEIDITPDDSQDEDMEKMFEMFVQFMNVVKKKEEKHPVKPLGINYKLL
jgi:transcriptional regulator with XRE-family HTH domain